MSSADFWVGSEAFPHTTFYAYAYPEPPGFRDSPVTPGARYEESFGEFMLPYETMRSARDPDALLLDFLARRPCSCRRRRPLGPPVIGMPARHSRAAAAAAWLPMLLRILSLVDARWLRGTLCQRYPEEGSRAMRALWPIARNRRQFPGTIIGWTEKTAGDLGSTVTPPSARWGCRRSQPGEILDELVLPDQRLVDLEEMRVAVNEEDLARIRPGLLDQLGQEIGIAIGDPRLRSSTPSVSVRLNEGSAWQHQHDAGAPSAPGEPEGLVHEGDIGGVALGIFGVVSLAATSTISAIASWRRSKDRRRRIFAIARPQAIAGEVKSGAPSIKSGLRAVGGLTRKRPSLPALALSPDDTPMQNSWQLAALRAFRTGQGVRRGLPINAS